MSSRQNQSSCLPSFLPLFVRSFVRSFLPSFLPPSFLLFLPIHFHFHTTIFEEFEHWVESIPGTRRCWFESIMFKALLLNFPWISEKIFLYSCCDTFLRNSSSLVFSNYEGRDGNKLLSAHSSSKSFWSVQWEVTMLHPFTAVWSHHDPTDQDTQFRSCLSGPKAERGQAWMQSTAAVLHTHVSQSQFSPAPWHCP